MHSESTRGTHDAPAVLEAKLTLHSVRQSGLLSYQPLMPLMLMQRLLLRPCASCETVCVYVLGITMTITGIRVSSDNHHQRLGPSPTTLCYFHHPTRHLSLSVRVCSESGRGHQERRALVSRALKDQVPQWCVAMSLSVCPSPEVCCCDQRHESGSSWCCGDVGHYQQQQNRTNTTSLKRQCVTLNGSSSQVAMRQQEQEQQSIMIERQM